MKKILLFLCGLALLFTCNAAEKVLKSSLAGRWYTDNPVTLRAELKGYLSNAKQQSLDNVIALVLPHAGYRYSGQTAAYGLKALKKSYKRFIIIGPSHRLAMKNTLSIPNVTHYETPLGKVPLDRKLIAQLLTHDIFKSIPQAHQYEHSVQIEVPLLQVKAKGFTIIPIVIGSCDEATLKKAGNIIRNIMDDKTLLIASSDFVHYGRNFNYIPFNKDILENIKKIDFGAYEQIKKLDLNGFIKYRKTTGATICGTMSIGVLLAALPNKTAVHKLFYTTSGAMTGDYSNSVSYMSIAFCGKWTKNVPARKNDQDALTQADKKTLLILARKSLTYYLKNGKTPTPDNLGIKLNNRMKVKRAAFVTLKKKGNLRGCIGEIFPRQPLYKSIITNAINAGIHDPRFRSVTQGELKYIEFDISALTPPSQVSSYNKIRIGIDGVVLKKGLYSAVFLPQVAPEQGWNLEQTLTYLARKAGLPPDGWKKGATFLTFQADVFGENEHKHSQLRRN
jgi:MEMO1 family protein